MKKNIKEIPLNPLYEMLRRNIDYQLRNNKPIASVTLSRAKYDKLHTWLNRNGMEEWALSLGYTHAEVSVLPLTYRNIEILRADDARMEDITINYRNIIAKEERLDFLDKNLSNLNTQDNKMIDALFNQIKTS